MQTQKGYAFKSDWYQPNGVPIVKVSDFTQDSIDPASLTCISESRARDLRRYELTCGDILIQTVGSWPSNPKSVVGKVVRVPRAVTNALLNQNAVKIVPREGISSDFLYYLLKSRFFSDHIVNCAQGAASQASITLEDIRKFSFSLPELTVQRHIAAILAAYDDLIANNARRIAILEEMARALYREWFVELQFPGHEGVPMVGSAMGLIPEGWRAKRLADTCTIVMGQSPPSQFYNAQGIGLPFHQGVTDFGRWFPSDRIYCTLMNRIAEPGDILFSVRAPVGRINVADKRLVIGRGISAIRSNGSYQNFVLLQFMDQFQEVDTIGNGAIFKAVTKEDVHAIRMLWPVPELIERFEGQLTPIIRQVKALTMKNANLRRTRDLLLPKLVSGEIDVADIPSEIEV